MTRRRGADGDLISSAINDLHGLDKLGPIVCEAIKEDAPAIMMAASSLMADAELDRLRNIGEDGQRLPDSRLEELLAPASRLSKSAVTPSSATTSRSPTRIGQRARRLSVSRPCDGRIYLRGAQGTRA
jgi:hypothetical protein